MINTDIQPLSQDQLRILTKILGDFDHERSAAASKASQILRDPMKTSHQAAASTVEAVMYQLRTRGVAELSVPSCQHRLSELSTAQLREVIGRLIRIKPKYPSITDELILRLGDQL